MATRPLSPLLKSFFTPTLVLRFPAKPPKTLFSFTRSASSSPMASSVKKVLVSIANGTEPMEAVITIDVLRRSGAEVVVASVGSDHRVDACWGVKLVADALVSDCKDQSFDLISLPVWASCSYVLVLRLSWVQFSS